jgi:membrane protein
VENIKVGVLGSLGVALLFYTVMSMIQKVETSFNFIWRVETSRGLGQRIGEYLSMLLVGPLAVVLALGMTASVMNSEYVARLTQVEPLGLAFYVIGRLVPYAVIVGLFTFMYSFIPNTRVRLRAAFAGGLLAGVMWQSAGLGFASFVASSPNYNAIYAGFAIVILLLIWLYVAWLILLIGCQLAYYVQYPERLAPTRIPPQLSGRAGETLGLVVMALVGRRFIAGDPPLTRDQLHREVAAAPDHIDRVINVLLHHGVLAESGADGCQLLPRRDLDSLTLAQLWQLLREGVDVKIRVRSGVALAVHDLIEDAESGFASGTGKMTVRDWVGGLKPAS